MNKNFSTFFENLKNQKKIKIGEILKGTIINVYKKFVLVDVGLKSESYVPIEEFEYNDYIDEIKIGDKIDFILESIENDFGETIISRNKAKQYENWIKLEKYFIEEKIIIGNVLEKIKGGFIIEINDIKAFLPGSLVDFKSIKDSYNLEGKKLELKIIKIDKKNRSIIVSRKAITEKDSNIDKLNLLNKFKENDIISGIVKNITNYGVFVDLGGIDGLLHITDITWKRIKHPSEIINIGDKINVKIIKFDYEKLRIYLGLKQLTKDPWFSIYEKYPKGLIINGRVTNLTDYGCFVEIENGIEGLVHISEMDWKNKNANPSKIVNVNEIIKVMILNVDLSKKRISLGLKQCKRNPWKIFSENYNVGDKIKGYIKSITDFGIFVELNNEVDGLIHITDLSWLINKNDDLNKYKKGEEILSIILSIDIDKNRISLGIKQLINDPYNDFINKKKIGDIVMSKIIEIDNSNILVSLNEYILGYIKINSDIIKNNNKYYIGNNIESKIENFDNKNRIINLLLN